MKEIKNIQDFLNIENSDIGVDFILNYFAYDENGKRKFSTKDIITIPANFYHNNPKPIKIQVSRWIFNKYFLDEFYDIVGIVDEPITNDVYEGIVAKLSEALLNDKITQPQMVYFLDKIQHFGFSLPQAFTASITEKTMFITPNTRKVKKEFIKKYGKELKNGDVVTSVKMEKALMDQAKKDIADDPGMDLYESGSKASFSNNYKSMNLMKGAIKDPITGEYHVSTSDYLEGIQKGEIEHFANAGVIGAYSKGVGTQSGGYKTKQFYAAFQTIIADKKGSDCKTKMCRKVLLTEKNKKLYLYRYIVSNGKLICLDDDVINKYIGKIVFMRDPMYCTGDRICNICAGDMEYKLGIENVGLTTNKMSSTLMNKSLKKFHDTSIKLYELKIDDSLVID